MLLVDRVDWKDWMASMHIIRSHSSETEPIQKIDKYIARKLPSIDVPYRRIKYLPTIRKIQDELWNGMRSSYCFHRKNQKIT